MHSSVYRRSTSSPRLHHLLAALCLAMVLLQAGPAAAQFAVNEIQLYDPDPDPDARLSDYQIANEFFSKANCECRKSVRIRLRITIDRQNTNKFFVVAGSGTCIDTNQNAISESCKPILKEGRIDQQAQDIEITTGTDGVTVYDLMQGNCTADQQLNIYVFTGQENAITQAGTLAFTADGTAPTAPIKDGEPEPGEELVKLTFKTGSTTETNVRYQILCEEANTGQPGLANPTSPGYSYCATPQNGSDAGIDSGSEADAGVPDQGVPDQGPPDGGVADGAVNDGAADAGAPDTGTTSQDSGSSGSITSLDPRFVCSQTLTSAGGTEVGGLKNGVNYRFYVVAFDLHGNASSPVLLGEATPLLSEDLWERYKRSGGPATGGYCAVAEDGAAPPWLLIGLLALGLLWRREVHDDPPTPDRRAPAVDRGLRPAPPNLGTGLRPGHRQLRGALRLAAVVRLGVQARPLHA